MYPTKHIFFEAGIRDYTEFFLDKKYAWNCRLSEIVSQLFFMTYFFYFKSFQKIADAYMCFLLHYVQTVSYKTIINFLICNYIATHDIHNYASAWGNKSLPSCL